jgi:hypothetical protein
MVQDDFRENEGLNMNNHVERANKWMKRKYNKILKGCIHDWGTKKEWPIFKGLQKTTLDFFKITLL